MPRYSRFVLVFLRYMDPTTQMHLRPTENIIHWKEVDLYIGGTELTVGHLMYPGFA